MSASSPSLVWFIGRGSGIIAFVLLTLAVLLGITVSQHWASQRWPRILIDNLHRWTVLVFYVFLAVHTVTMFLDPFAHFTLRDVTVPFGSAYRPVWLGLGVLAGEVTVAIGASALIRNVTGYRLWHWLHLGLYPVFVLSLLHSIGTGTDTTEPWLTLLYVGSTAAVLGATVWRLAQQRELRRWVLAGSTVLSFGVLIWAVRGPYAPGWATKAGTPALLLKAAAAQRGITAVATPSAPTLPQNLNVPLAGETLVGRDGAQILLRGQAVGSQPFDVAIEVLRGQGQLSGQVQLRTSAHVPWCAGPITGLAAGNVINATCSGYGQQVQLQVTINSLNEGGWSGELRTSGNAAS
ncbi:MAG: ferric reductase-like transmembrane domain-containing protein [Chloroflexi bacterium]|nr:ferric reductase-like transmembrane domain-containing protein [Chloroflexota bacterium]